ncbi:ABC transporter ATP-binding protein [Devosia sp. J2-20]|jgi:branched-chain amino acid transport system ATP-binding protein|uniref:ABC transporter ATP-binding protein n=1 Tax=Devosia TaxID=46913 RepID=UPI00201684A1|nr:MULTISPECIES: ABC transporter ATP-binding protein [Devosia]MCZ4346859.1 ABC transporter ATP-binding protein [Devosia neptuniae]WDR00590.1 ABC transporter ATP-binding protein [Devosia sp. J2-20]|tara:strand:- start:4679 stop:5404 length:726 start_codon:yes stop_codon:yes gene_type:complete
MSTPAETILQLEGVTAGYGRIVALNGIDLKVETGAMVTLLGANGAGKTTTLKTISGLVRATGGRVLFEGEDITQTPAHEIARRGLVHVPEGRHVLRGLSVRENLELGAFTVKDPALRAKRMKEVFGLFPVLEKRQHGDGSLLSGGEQQMLAIGRALMHGPRLLLLDEPSMGLAPKLVIETMQIVKRLHEAGTTILLVEQNARLALKLADYGYVLEGGHIRMQGEAATLRADKSIVQAYLGE